LRIRFKRAALFFGLAIITYGGLYADRITG
jgi:hypothetical protein